MPIFVGFQFRKIWSWKKVSVSVSENLVSEKKFWFQKIWSRKKSQFSVLVSILRFLPILEGFGIGFGEFGLGKKVSVLVSEKSISFNFEKFRLRRKVSISVSKNLLSEKILGFGKFGTGKKVSVLVLVKILVSSFSVGCCARAVLSIERLPTL